MNKKSLRGGGGLCSSKTQKQINNAFPLNIDNDQKMIQMFISNVTQRCQNILISSQKIGSQEQKDSIIQEIKWFQLSSQYLHQIIQDKQMVKENIKLVFQNLEILLEAIVNIIESQIFLSCHLLKICNLFSQLIFIYYISEPPKPPMKLEIQNNYLNQLAEIEKYIEFGGQSCQKITITYELEVIKMCINTCPNDSTKGQEILIGTFSGIISSVTKMSPSTELINSLLDGAIYVYQKIKQKNQKKTFQVVFYLEQLKWIVIEQIQQGMGISRIRSSLLENYNKLILPSSQWIIKCSWIKLISEFLQYTPIITKKIYEALKKQYEFYKNWNQIIQQKIVKLIDNTGYFGVIISDSDEEIGRIFSIQSQTFQQLMITCLNGYQDLPRFDVFVNEQNQKNIENYNEDKLIQILEYIDNLQIPQFQRMYYKLLQNLQESIENWNFLQQNEIEVEIQKYKIEHQIRLTSNLETQLMYIVINTKIINEQLKSFINIEIIEDNKETQNTVNLLNFYTLIRDYFKIIQMSGIKNKEILNDYNQFTNGFPDTKIRSNIHQLDKEGKFQIIIDQLKDQDLNQLIALLDKNCNQIQEQSQLIKPLTKIKSFIELVDQYIEILQFQFRKILLSHLTKLYYLEQKLFLTNQVIENNFIQEFIGQFQIYHSIISQEVNQMLNELQFNKDQIEQFKFLPNSEIFILYNFATDDEIQMVSENQQIKLPSEYDSLSAQFKLKEIQILLSMFNQIEIKRRDSFKNLIIWIQQQKSKYLQMAEQTSMGELTDEDQLIQNSQSINEIMQQGGQQSNLIKLLKLRINILQKIQKEHNNNQQVQNYIQKDIVYIQLLCKEQFCQLIESKKQEFLVNLQLSNNNILSQLKGQKQLENEVNDQQLVNKIIKNMDEIIQSVNKQIEKNEVQQVVSQKQINLIIFEVQNLLYSGHETKNDILDMVEKQFKLQIENYQEINMVENLQVKNLIQDNFKLIKSLTSRFVKQDLYLDLIPNFGEKSQVQEQKGFLQEIREVFSGDSWRFKEYFYFCCLQTYSITKDKYIKSQLGRIILIGKYKETDFRIRATLNDKDYLKQIELLVNTEWSNCQEDIQISLQQTLNELQSLQLQLQGEERKQQRESLIKLHKELEEKLEQQIKNVNQIGDILGITIYFMKEIQKQLLLIQSKLDNIIDSINQIGQDIKFLRGKSPQQLLEIRMEYVLQNKFIQDSSSVYVQVQVKEFNFDQMKQDENTHLFNYDHFQDGEIDEFLSEQNKTSLLIHGPAGSGKSIAARKIEEYLWIQYKKQVNGQIWNQNIGLKIPIFIQLPTLKEPKFTAIEETLQSYQGINLIQNNELNQWKQKNEQQNPKVITTSRSEIFTNTNYRSWFWDNDVIGFKGFKEIKLQPFNLIQREAFLNQFSQLQVKLQIRDLLEIVSKKQQQDIIINETLLIYDLISKFLIQQKGNLLSDGQVEQIVKIIKQNQNVLNINQNQETSFSKQLLTRWSGDQYQQSIKQMEIEDILDTPFMLNIVVQVLPQMSEIVSSQNYIKQSFKQEYVRKKKSLIQSIVNRFQSNNQFIKNLYNMEEINSLQMIIQNNNQQLNDECEEIWNCLINSNFFKEFNVIIDYQDIIKLIQKTDIHKILLKQNKIKKEQQDDNINVIYKALVSQKQTIYQFYQFFLQNFIELQRIKLIYSNNIQDQNQFIIDVEQYATKFAVALTLQNMTTVEVIPKGLLFKQEEASPFRQFFEDQDQYADYRKLIRKCLPMRQKGYFYSFNHKSIQEYLFAKDIIKFLSNTSIEHIKKIIQLRHQISSEIYTNLEKYENEIKQYEKSSLNQVNLSKQQLQGAFKFLKAAIQTNSYLQEICYNISLLSSVCDQLVTLSSNTFYILVNTKTQIKKKDLYKLNIQDISLNGSYIINCNLSDSRFKRISLNGINLTKSDLSRINWIDCQTNDLPILQSQEQIQSICFSSDGSKIIGGGGKGIISIWDKNSRQLIQQIQTKLEQIYYVGQIESKSIIAFGHDNLINYIQFWDENYKQMSQSFSVSKYSQIQKNQSGFKAILEQFSHNNSYVSLINDDKMLIVHRISDQKLINQKYFEQQISTIKIIQNQEIIYAFQSRSSTVIIWNFQDNTTQNFLVPITYGPEILYTFSQDCQFLIQYYTIQIQQYDLKNNYHCQRIFQRMCQYLAYSQTNRYLAYSNGNTIWITDTKNLLSLTQPLIGHSSQVTSLKFNEEQTEFITSSWDGKIKYWDLNLLLNQNNDENQDFKYIKRIQYSSDGLLLYYSYKKALFVLDLQSGELVDQIDFTFNLFFVCNSGRFIYFFKKHSRIIFQYDINSKNILELVSGYKCPDDLKKFNKTINAIQSQDYRLFCLFNQLKTGYTEYDETIILFLEDDAQKIKYYINVSTKYLQFSFDFKHIYYNDDGKAISTMQIHMEEVIDKFLVKMDQPKFNHEEQIIQFIIKQDDKFILSISKCVLQIWNIQTNQLISKFTTPYDYAQIKYSFKEEFLIFTVNKNIYFHDSENFKTLGRKQASHAQQIIMIDVAPNKNEFVTLGYDAQLKVWKTRKQDLNNDEKNYTINIQERFIIPKHLNQETLIYDVKFKDSQIQSHLNYDLINIWTQRK